MDTPTARNGAPAGSEYAETVRSNHCTVTLDLWLQNGISSLKEKEHLIELAEELGLIVEASLTKPKLKDLIVKSPDYIEDDVKVMIDSIVKDRIRTEEEKLRREQREYEEKLRPEEREYELEKLRIQAEKNANTMNNPKNVQAPKVIHETFHKFNMKDDISLNLTLFERHAELTFLPKKRIGYRSL
ncbi:transposon Tf2-6 polyprotein [Trichonephila clavipes]|nr:transposon Tf2-6 polyprotein [Trichonephila clavipes]